MNVCVVWIAVRYYRCLENGARVDSFFLNNPSTALRARLNLKKKYIYYACSHLDINDACRYLLILTAVFTKICKAEINFRFSIT